MSLARSLSNERKTIAGLAVAFCLLSVASLVGMMGVGQVKGDKWLDARVAAVQEIQSIRQDFGDVLLSSQRYIVTGEPLQQSVYSDSVDALKEDLFRLQTIEGGQYARSEKVRALVNGIQLALDQIAFNVKGRPGKTTDAAKALLLSGGQLHDLSQLSRSLLTLEQEEQTAIRGYYTGDIKARGNTLPLAAFVLAICTFVVAMVQFMSGRQDELYGEESGPQADPHVVAMEEQLREAQSQLERLANFDFLTEVLNVRGLEQVLKTEDNRTSRSGSHLIAMLINCDNFKKVNEGLGYATGDVLLKEVAKRIKGVLRPSDHVARVGGDEFLVLLPDTQLAYGLKVAERIRVAIADAPLKHAQDVIDMTASIGVAHLPQNVASAQEAITLSRSALKRSKSTGKNKVSIARDVTPEKQGEVGPRSIVEQLTDASQFRTVYQPIMRLASEEIAGYEALSRGPDGAFESPADFFRICVENNILTSVDLQCLRLCLQDIPKTGKNMRLHVNLFPSTLIETPIENLLSLFPASRNGTIFCIEISEQEFVTEPAHLRDHVSALKQAGILVAIDDVGFGRSSLETLILLEPDLVKIDRKYVAGLSAEPAKARLLRRLTNVAKSLGSEIIAEGIEDRKDLPLLLEMGVDYGQGFLWGDLLPVLPLDFADKEHS